VVVEAVDDTVSVEVCAEPFTLTGLGETAQVMGLVVPVGLVVIAQVSPTEPVNPFTGAAVMVDVLPDVAPCTKLRLVGLALSENVGAETVTVTVADCVMLPEVPVTVMT
jgi:hypothetical protein